jgi:hypothetical protein
MNEQELESDERLFVKIYMGLKENAAKSEQEGHPVYDNVPFIRIIVPGDKNTVVDTPVTNAHKKRFPKVWERFEKAEGSADVPAGMPIREWPGVSRSQAEELSYHNIFTVEQLANVADTHAQKIVNFHELKRKAIVYVQTAKDGAANQKLAAENEKLQTQITALQEQMQAQAAAFAQLQAQLGGGDVNGVGGASNRRK